MPACAWGLIHEAITSSLDGSRDAYKTQIGEEEKDCKICCLSLGCAWEAWEVCRRVGLMWRGCQSRRSWDVHQCTTRDGWYVVTKQFSVGFQFPSYKPIMVVNSPAVLGMQTCTNIFHIQFSYLLFCNPTHKTETGTANRWGLLISNHLDQSLW